MDYLTHLASQSDAFLSACRAGELSDPVATCPGWTIADLLGHLAVVQRFHGSHLTRGVTDPPPGPRPTPPPPDQLVDFFTEGHAMLLDNLQNTPPSAPAWTFEPGNQTVAFWRRRMAHEALVHRWDAEHARGEAGPLPLDLTLDAIAEYLAVFLPRGRAEDAPQGEVTFIVPGERTYISRHGDAEAATATVTGSAEQLLLLLWGRLPLEVADVEGDQDLARSLINR